MAGVLVGTNGLTTIRRNASFRHFESGLGWNSGIISLPVGVLVLASGNKLWISKDKGVTWESLELPTNASQTNESIIGVGLHYTDNTVYINIDSRYRPQNFDQNNAEMRTRDYFLVFDNNKNPSFSEANGLGVIYFNYMALISNTRGISVGNKSIINRRFSNRVEFDTYQLGQFLGGRNIRINEFFKRFVANANSSVIFNDLRKYQGSIDFEHNGNGKTQKTASFRQWAVEGIGASFRIRDPSNNLTTTRAYLTIEAINGMYDGTGFLVALAQGTVIKVEKYQTASNKIDLPDSPSHSVTGQLYGMRLFKVENGFGVLILSNVLVDRRPQLYFITYRNNKWDSSWKNLADSDTPQWGSSEEVVPYINIDRFSCDNCVRAQIQSFTDQVYYYAAPIAEPGTVIWVTQNKSARVDQTLRLDWRFTSPNLATQAKIKLKRTISGQTRYWNGSSWVSSVTEITRTQNNITLPVGWGKDTDADHYYRLIVVDSNGEDSNESGDLVINPYQPAPGPIITSPTEGQLIGGAFEFQWTTTRPQIAYKVDIYNSAGTVVLHTSEWITSPNKSYRYVLQNGSYGVRVTYRDNNNNESLVSGFRKFSINLSGPKTTVIKVRPVFEDGLKDTTVSALHFNAIYLQIDSTVTGNTGADIEEVELFRHEVDREDFRDIDTVPKLITTENSGNFSYKDLTVADGVSYQYRLRVHGNNGSLLETDWTPK